MNRKLSLLIVPAFLLACGGVPPVEPPPEEIAEQVVEPVIQEVIPPGQENLNATLWVQTSAEFKGAAVQAYHAASVQLDRAILDKTWVATDEQTNESIDLPPAIILDLDETVLDNSPYQARLIQTGTTYSTESWDKWCNEGKADAIPGALEFLKEAHDKGVTIFYVSNRVKDVEEATRKNLAMLGAPLDDKIDTVLLKKEQPEWGSDKRPRRALIAKTHRIIMMFGDNMGDFIVDGKGDTASRVKLMNDNSVRIGKSWFLLPNPMYGYWEASLFDYNYKLPDEEKDAAKKSRLNPK